MSDHERTKQAGTAAESADGNGSGHRPALVALDGGDDGASPAPAVRPKIKWLRLLAIASGLGVLAVISTVFGMMMAVASDLPRLDVFNVSALTPSTVYDRTGKRTLGNLTSGERRVLVDAADIAPVMKQAIVSIEDKRFHEHSGVDFRGIARALYHDVAARKAVQGGSTITQQLVKNRLEAQNDRTIFQKLRESAIAFHMTRKWDKQRILTHYLNTIYFGNGAYGIESAARVYFRKNQHVGCGDPGQLKCAEQLEPHEAALLAGVIASPSAYDPIENPEAARARRNLVLQRMVEQGYITPAQRDTAAVQPLPVRGDLEPPREVSRYPYFTTWVRQQVVDRVGSGRAFEGGLRVHTSLDVDMQEAAESAVRQWMGANNEPSAAMVVLENESSEVLAMVGGPVPPLSTDPREAMEQASDAFNDRPFNLATQGQRQPGSAFKPFTLAEALRTGKYRPDSVVTSHKKEFCVTKRKGRCTEAFVVNNYEDQYAGASTLANATAFSDNAVYAEVGIDVGTRRIARLAEEMGIRTPVSTNYAMTLGGLKQGVTVMDMAHAYETIAEDGRLVYGTLSPGADTDVPGPVGLRRITKDGDPVETLDGQEAVNEPERKVVLPARVAQDVKGMLAGVVKFGTGRRASLGDHPAWGKTGTTEDYGDAWFVGSTPELTVAVWVGYPDKLVPMKPPNFSFNGEPVAGGTYPAAIWQTFMKQALTILESREAAREAERDEDDPELPDDVPPSPGTPVPTAPTPAPTTTAPSGQGGGGGGGETPPAGQPQQPAETAPEKPSQPAPPPPGPAQPPPAEEEGGAGAPTGGESADP